MEALSKDRKRFHNEAPYESLYQRDDVMLGNKGNDDTWRFVGSLCSC